MTESRETNSTEEPKAKLSFKEAINQQLEAKKAKQSGTASVTGGLSQTKKMKSQQAKQVNNSHRKMGV
jgi:hypothetical protein